MRLRPFLAAVALVLLVACGGGGGSKTTTTTSSSTTTPKPVANIVVDPAQGRVGTTFKLAGTGFKPGENVTFEIEFPDNRAPFKGASHPTTPDGAVRTTYTATSGNPPGTYIVKATGDQGTEGEGKFELTGAGGAPGPTTATTARSGAGTATTRASTGATTTVAP